MNKNYPIFIIMKQSSNEIKRMQELAGVINESTFDYEWGRGVSIGGDAPSDLRFYLDKKLNKIVYSYKGVQGILKDEDKKNLMDFLKQFE